MKRLLPLAALLMLTLTSCDDPQGAYRIKGIKWFTGSFVGFLLVELTVGLVCGFVSYKVTRNVLRQYRIRKQT